jgi:hypothetical protein
MSDYLRALYEEQAGYERMGFTDRVAEVQAEIDRVTGAAEERAVTVAKSEAPRKRTARRVDHA